MDLDLSNISGALVLYVTFVLSVTLHEAAHAWSAMRGGDLTAYRAGQVSLDPIPHIRREPFGMVILPVLCTIFSGWPLGYASAPYDPAWAARYPRRAAWMALAGPAANLVLVLIAASLIQFGVRRGVFVVPDQIGFMDVVATQEAVSSLWLHTGHVIGAFFSLNLLLFVFNLLPFPPLDGGAAIILLMPKKVAVRYQAFVWGHPQFSWFGILLAWNLFAYFLGPIFEQAIKLLYPGTNYFW
jgi:Zn-dependent protease